MAEIKIYSGTSSSNTAMTVAYSAQVMSSTVFVNSVGINEYYNSTVEKEVLTANTFTYADTAWTSNTSIFFQPNQSALKNAQTTSLVLIVSENNWGIIRYGRFRIKAKDTSGNDVYSNWFYLTQEKYESSTVFDITPSIQTLPSSQSSFEVTWTISPNVSSVALGSSNVPSWVTKTYLSSTSLFIEVAENATVNTRTTSIELYAKDGNGSVLARRVVQINQEGISSADSIITLSPKSLSFDYQSHNGTINATTLQGYEITSVESSQEFVTLSSFTQSDNVTIGYTVNTNSTYVNRSANIIFTATHQTSGTTVSKTLAVTQRANSNATVFPIWKDTDIELPVSSEDVSFIWYKVLIQDKVAYSGKSYKINGKITVRLNDVLRDYVSGSLDLSSSSLSTKSHTNEDGMITAYLYVSEDNWNTEQLQNKIICWNSWSYDDTLIAYHPIENELDYRQIFVATLLNINTNTSVPLRPKRGLISINGVPYQQFQCGMYDYKNIAFKVSDIVGNGYNSTISYSTDGAETRTFKLTCRHKYALYFRDIWGGYTWLLLNSASKRSDSLSILGYERQINNYTMNRSKVQYQKTVTEKVALKTDRLTDKQAELVALAMRSVDCYLHNLETDEIEPVNITDTSVQYTTYLNNKHKPFNYTINVELAKDKFSR